MPNPLKARRPGTYPGLRRGNIVKVKPNPQVKEISRKLILDPKYQAMLKTKLRDGSLHPSMQVCLWYYAFGKPKDEIDVRAVTAVKIVHEYAEEHPEQPVGIIDIEGIHDGERERHEESSDRLAEAGQEE